MDDTFDARRQVFFPNASKAFDAALAHGGRFAYYTTAATALLVLENEEIWMRNTAVMNDYMEVEHGLECLVQAYQEEAGAELRDAMDECFPGVSEELTKLFNSWIPTIKTHTYIASFSEHEASEDDYGRLSMWRAYGGTAGVALIFNGGPLFRPSDALMAYSSPVAYMRPSNVANELRTIARNIRQHKVEIQRQGRDHLRATMFEALRFGAVCTKHPAFAEEREWRVISTQLLHKSERLVPEVEVIGGIPQLVLKLKLQDHPEEGLYGIEIPSFLDRILIGPCEHPEPIRAALIALLAKRQVPEPEKKVIVTGVPLRPNQR